MSNGIAFRKILSDLEKVTHAQRTALSHADGDRIIQKIVSELQKVAEMQRTALTRADGDRITQRITFELRKVTEAQLRSFTVSVAARLEQQLEELEAISILMKSLALAISIFLAVYIWRQLEEERRAREIHDRNMQRETRHSDARQIDVARPSQGIQ